MMTKMSCYKTNNINHSKKYHWKHIADFEKCKIIKFPHCDKKPLYKFLLYMKP